MASFMATLLLLAFNIMLSPLSSPVSAYVTVDISGRSENAAEDGGPVPFNMENTPQWGGYNAKFKIGTPGQVITMQAVSSAEDILWVPPSNSSVCRNTTAGGYGPCSFGGYQRFWAGDEDGNATGTQFTDSLQLGDMTIANLTMGLADAASWKYVPVLSLTHDHNRANRSVLYQMVYQARIPTLAYSIWLDRQDKPTGQLLLGAIDKAKYDGPLTSLQLYDRPRGSPGEIWVCMSSLRATSYTGSDDLSWGPFPVKLGLGMPFAVLPRDMAFRAWSVVGAVRDGDGGYGIVPCSLRASDAFLTFGLGGAAAGDAGARIDVPVANLVVSEEVWDPSMFPAGPGGEPRCVFGIQAGSRSEDWTLGEPFLRSAYAVVDLHNRRLAVAPVRAGAAADESRVVSFNGNGAPVPSAAEAPGQPATATWVDYAPSIADWAAVESGAFSAAEGFQNPEDGGLSWTARIGVGCGVGLGAAIMLVVIGRSVFWLRGRRRPQQEPAVQDGLSCGSGMHRKPEMAADPIDPAKTLQRYYEIGISPQSPSELHGRELPVEMVGCAVEPEVKIIGKENKTYGLA